MAPTMNALCQRFGGCVRYYFFLGLLAVSAIPVGAGDLQWRNLGPGGGGWIQSLACDPRSPDTLYLGCDVGGFYRSDNAGKTWTIYNEGLSDYFIERIAIHPTDSNLIMLAAEGGVFKSTDGGRHWQWKRAGFPKPSQWSFTAPVSCLCFDPQKPDLVYCGIGRPRWRKDGQGAIYKSEDCGETWKLLTPPGTLPEKAIIQDLQSAPDSSYLLAATDQGLFRSTDAGVTWVASNAGLPPPSLQRVAISARNPLVVYCTLTTTARDQDAWNGGVYRSEDGGKTWAARCKGLADRVGKANEALQMTSNLMPVVIDPRDDNVVYVGDRAWVSAGVYKTTDGGLNWSRVTDHFSANKNMDYGWIRQWGPAAECLALSAARPDRLVFGTSGHVFLTDDGGRRWQQRYCRQFEDGRFAGNGLSVTCTLNATPDVADPQRWYFGFMDIGLLISEDRGESFRTSDEGLKDSGNCFALLQDPADPKKLWVGTGQWGLNRGFISRSTDGGMHWTLVGEEKTGLPCGQVQSLLLDPSSLAGKRTLYATCNGFGVYKSLDEGTSWQGLNTGLPEEARKKPCRLLRDPRDPRHLRLALGGRAEGGSGVYDSADGGVGWTRVNEAALFADLKNFVADPTNFDVLYLCQREWIDWQSKPEKRYPGGLYKSTDGGRQWECIFEFHFVSCVAINPRNPQIVYVGTTDHPFHDDNRASGVWKSKDGGKTWQQEVDGLTNWHVSNLTVDPREPSRLFVGTGGNGIFVGRDR